MRYYKPGHNELQELIIATTDHLGISKHDIIHNFNKHLPAKAKQIIVHLAYKHDILDSHRIAWFMDITLDNIYQSNVVATNRLLYYKDFRDDYKQIESNFVNKNLSIYKINYEEVLPPNINVIT